MKPADLARYKEKLEKLRAEIVAEGDVEIEPARKDADDVGGDEDQAPYSEMNQVIASKRNRVRTDVLGKITKALARLGEDPEMFELCVECEEPIGKRLELLPYVELCVECQQAKDGGPKLGSRRSVTDYR